MIKKVCIVGTAASHRETPWDDLGMKIWSLNDAFMLPGFKRADAWFDPHPLDKFIFRPKTQKSVRADEIPHGHYLRPDGYVEWLKEQAKTIPVYLQQEPPVDWPPNAQRIPFEAIFEAFGVDYWASGPSYMVALAVLQGYTEIWITGIHLSTQGEYIEQRPQFENLLGRVLGMKQTVVVKDGFRHYTGSQGITIVLPVSCPLMMHQWKYALEAKPQPAPNPYRDELKQAREEKQKLMALLVNWPEGKDKSGPMERLRRTEIIELDCANMLAKAHSIASQALVAAL